MCFIEAEADGTYGEMGEELFALHPECWAPGEFLGELNEHTVWLIGLAASNLKTLRTQYAPDHVPECAASCMSDFNQALAGLLNEFDLLRSVAREFQER